MYNVKSSHKGIRVNDKLYEWLESMYGDPKIAPAKATQGKMNEYLAMKLDYSTPGVVKVNMTEYIKGMIKEFPVQLPESSNNCPWNENLFEVNSAARRISIKKAQVLHTPEDVLTLKADATCIIKWHIAASFALFKDFKSHTGGVMTMGQGAIQTISAKQKVNT
jgi:hypothetical protein